MTYQLRKAGFLAGTATATAVTAQSDNPTTQPRDGPQPDDGDLLVGYRRMSEFAISENYPVATSTLQKRGSPAIAAGPELVGYFGRLPATNKGKMRAWLRANLRSDRPPTKRLKAYAAVAASPAGEAA